MAIATIAGLTFAGCVDQKDVHSQPATSVVPSQTSTPAKTGAQVADGLQQFWEGKLPPEQLKISYSDLHGLHGGLELSVTGDGKVQQKTVRVADAKPPTDLSAAQMRQLAKLVLKLRAWEQKIPERAPVPDESRATLTIAGGSGNSDIWERYNDMKRTGRMTQIVELLKNLEWKR